MTATASPQPPSIDAGTEPARPHYPALDGLRGGAILLVLACHYAWLLPGDSLFAGVLMNGWIGVDCFFVLSGFLITGLLVDAKGAQPAREFFRNFYARRVLRIFPLYYGFLAVVLIILLVLKATGRDGGNDARLAWKVQPWLWTYTANWKFAFMTTWSDWLDPLAVLWSLSIEEQFYLVWPVVVLLCSRRALGVVCVAVIAGAVATRLALTAHGTNFFAIYVLTPTRADALAAGALLAVLIRSPREREFLHRRCTLLAAAAIVLVLIASKGFDPRHPWVRDLLFTPLALFFAAWLVCAISPLSLRGIPNRFYSTRPMRAIGRYSYGMYVFHLPLLALTKWAFTTAGWYDRRPVTWPAALLMVALNGLLTFAVAAASFHGYEKHFLRLKRHFPEPGPAPRAEGAV